MKTATAMATALLIGLFAAVPVFATGTDNDDEEDQVLDSALSNAPLALEQGLAASASEGKPISAKYELDVDGLQLSVYTAKGEAFSEVIVDPRTGRVEKVIPITGGADLAAARAQREVMSQAKRSLEEVTSEAVAAHKGYRAVSAYPGQNGGRPVATVTLTNGSEWTEVEESLDSRNDDD